MVKGARVAVIGAGWAGLAAASHLAAQGALITLYEASRQAGGRARRVDWTITDSRTIALDNGQHILLGAYRQTLELMRLCGVRESEVLQRGPVCIQSAAGLLLRAPSLPAPLHMLAALALARGLSWSARYDMARLMARARLARWHIRRDCTVAEWLTGERQAGEITAKLWRPLCIAALNTPAEIASAQVFLNVLRDSLGATRHASDLLLPCAPLDALLPTAALKFIEAHHGQIALATRVARCGIEAEQIVITSTEGPTERFDAAVLAVPAHQVKGLIDTAETPSLLPLVLQCERFRWQPITTVYIVYPAEVKLAASMLALSENPHQGHFGQWVFDKGRLGGPAGLIAVVISAQGAHQELAQDQLAAAVVAQLRDQLGLMAQIEGVRVISEKRATFACVPGLERPTQATPVGRLALAGDYTESDYPATLETAVESGFRAAQLIRVALGPA